MDSPAEWRWSTLCRIDPVVDLVWICRSLYAEATRDQLQRLTIWLAASMKSCQDVAIAQVDQDPLTWAPVRLSFNNVQFNDSCLDAEVKKYADYK
jgi:hypothetical protein